MGLISLPILSPGIFVKMDPKQNAIQFYGIYFQSIIRSKQNFFSFRIFSVWLLLCCQSFSFSYIERDNIIRRRYWIVRIKWKKITLFWYKIYLWSTFLLKIRPKRWEQIKEKLWSSIIANIYGSFLKQRWKIGWIVDKLGEQVQVVIKLTLQTWLAKIMVNFALNRS